MLALAHDSVVVEVVDLVEGDVSRVALALRILPILLPHLRLTRIHIVLHPGPLLEIAVVEGAVR